MKVRKKQILRTAISFAVRGILIKFFRFPSHLLLWLFASHKPPPDPDRRPAPKPAPQLDPAPLPAPNPKLNPNLESLTTPLLSTNVNLLNKKNPVLKSDKLDNLAASDLPEKLGLNPKFPFLSDLP